MQCQQGKVKTSILRPIWHYLYSLSYSSVYSKCLFHWLNIRQFFNMCCKGYLPTHYRHNNRLFYLLIQYVSKAYRNEVLRLACVSQPAWEMYIQAFEAFENGKLKGQKLTRKQLMTKPEIKQTQFQSLLPLQEAKQVELLQKLVSKEITLKELKQTAAKEKRMGDVKEKFLHLTNCNKWEEAEERFLQHATDKALEQFVTLDFTKETPRVQSFLCLSCKMAILI